MCRTSRKLQYLPWVQRRTQRHSRSASTLNSSLLARFGRSEALSMSMGSIWMTSTKAGMSRSMLKS